MLNDSMTKLASELCDLMKGNGATPTAIRGMPELMGLAYIRAEAPSLDDGNAQEEAVAVTVRECVEQASYGLEEPVSQREDKDADRGAAARCLLGLHPGTGSMLLWERRVRAAGYLIKHVRTMTKPRKVKGRMVSQETILMEQLANQLLEREADFLRDSHDRDAAHHDIYRDTPWLKIAHGAWSTASELATELKHCCDVLRPAEPDQEYYARCDYNSLELFGKLWAYIMIPKVGDPFLAAVGTPEGEIAKLFPNGDIALLYYMGPFKRAALERLSSEIVDAPAIAPVPVVRDLITPWRAWLQTCGCDIVEPNLFECSVHRFRSTLEDYIKKLGECWEDLRDPYRTPRHYKPDQTPAEIIEQYGLRAPTIDKNTKHSV